jgi:hypothetical protein
MPFIFGSDPRDADLDDRERNALANENNDRTRQAAITGRGAQARARLGTARGARASSRDRGDADMSDDEREATRGVLARLFG